MPNITIISQINHANKPAFGGGGGGGGGFVPELEPP
jgi:hypothetical protein